MKGYDTVSTNLSFHESFPVERKYLSELLRFSVDQEGNHSKEEISTMTGIPTGAKSGKVVPHIKYSAYMGLISCAESKGMYHIKPTYIGEKIYNEDPFFVEELTILHCHYELVNNAPLWSFIFTECIPNLGTRFQTDRITTLIHKKFNNHKVKLSPFRTCYTESKSLGDLNILEISNDIWEFRKHEVKRNYRYLYGYQLLKKWEDNFPLQSDISINLLTEDLDWGKPYIWSEETKMDVLDMLRDDGLITINRQLSPVSIIRNSTSDEVIGKIYSLLL